MTELAYLDGPAPAAVSDQLVAVYRVAMAAPPFFEAEVETGWFAAELADELDEAGYRCWVGRDGDRVVGFAYGFPTPEVPAGGLLERLLAGAGTERAWLVTHDLDTPARALYRFLGFRELGHGPLGWHDADRVVLAAELGADTAEPDPPGWGPQPGG